LVVPGEGGGVVEQGLGGRGGEGRGGREGGWGLPRRILWGQLRTGYS
jgi:hypothetical protein